MYKLEKTQLGTVDDSCLNCKRPLWVLLIIAEHLYKFFGWIWVLFAEVYSSFLGRILQQKKIETINCLIWKTVIYNDFFLITSWGLNVIYVRLDVC